MKRIVALFLALMLTFMTVIIPVLASDGEETTESSVDGRAVESEIKLPNPEDFAADALEALEENGVISRDEEGNVVFEYSDEICTFYAELSDKLYDAYLELKPTDKEMEDFYDFIEEGLSFIQGIWSDFIDAMTDEELREELADWFDESVDHIHKATEEIKDRIEAAEAESSVK